MNYKEKWKSVNSDTLHIAMQLVIYISNKLVWLQMVNDLNTPSFERRANTWKPENQLHSEKVWGSRYFIVVNSIKN